MTMGIILHKRSLVTSKVLGAGWLLTLLCLTTLGTAKEGDRFFYADLHKNEKDGLFFMDLAVGQPQQEFKALLTTSDDNSTIVSAQCVDKCDVPRRYDQSRSPYSSNSQIETEAQLCFYNKGFISDTELSGLWIEDNVIFGNKTSAKQLSQSLLAITDTRFSFSSEYSSHIGLAPPQPLHSEGSNDGPAILGGATRQKSILMSAKSQGLIDKMVFAVYANQNSSVQSSIKFGGYDQSAIAPGHQLTYLPTSGKRAWTVEASEITVGQAKVNKTNGEAVMVLVEPLLPYMYVPHDSFKDFSSAASKELGQLGLRCSHSHCYFNQLCDEILPSLANFTLNFEFENTQNLSIKAERLIVSEEKLYNDGHQRCYLAVFPKRYDVNTWYLGSQIMADYYTVFDMSSYALDDTSNGHFQVGFAKLNPTGFEREIYIEPHEKKPDPEEDPHTEPSHEEPVHPKEPTRPTEPKHEEQHHHDEQKKPGQNICAQEAWIMRTICQLEAMVKQVYDELITVYAVIVRYL